jgi:hypothetical protein
MTASGAPSRPGAARILALLPVLLAGACSSASGGTSGDRANEPPAAGRVRDGAGDDRDHQPGTSSLFANWDDFRDPEGLPVVYEWTIGRAPGATDVMAWTPVGGATNASVEGITLPVGETLYVSVRARDLAGTYSATATSDGIAVGTAEPVPNTPATGAVGEEFARASTLERFGIAWTFDRVVRCGRFANGDWWVLGPVNVIAISPPCTSEGGRTRNGSMINPDPRSPLHGYDSAMFEPGGQSGYERSRNVATDVSAERPLRLPGGSSLVSVASHAQPGQMPQLETCAVLTCLLQQPPEGAFRPPYCGSDKRCRWLLQQLDLGRLASVEAPAGAPDLLQLAERFERTWLDHLGGWTGRLLHPRLNMPDYGRDIADLVGLGGLALQLDLPLEQKRPLAIAMVQVGIDLYGIVDNGGRFAADGGTGSGRKFPVLLAGALLRDEALLRCARGQKFAFAEDAQTFHVEQTSPGVWNHGHGGYGPEDEGLPEWGNRHADDPSFDRKAWTDDPYRRCCTAHAWHGFVLATRIMGLVEAWGHDPLFDYVDRYMQVEPAGSWMRSWNPFAERMWDRYRPAY